MTPRPRKPPPATTSMPSRSLAQKRSNSPRLRHLSLCLAACCAALLLATVVIGSPQSSSSSSSSSQQQQDKQLLRKALDDSLAQAGNSSSLGAGNFQCPEQFGYYTDTRDCTKYYVCVFGEVLHESCTGGLRFSRELQTCDWPRNVNCPQLSSSTSAANASSPTSGGGGRSGGSGADELGNAAPAKQGTPASSLVFADEGSDPQQPSFDEAVAPVITPDGSIHLHDGSGGTYGLTDQHNRAATAASDRQGERGSSQLDVFVKPVVSQHQQQQQSANRPRDKLKPSNGLNSQQTSSLTLAPRQLQPATLPAQRPSTSVHSQHLKLASSGSGSITPTMPSSIPTSTSTLTLTNLQADQEEDSPGGPESGAGQDSENGGVSDNVNEGDTLATTTDSSLGAQAEREEEAEADGVDGIEPTEATSPRPPSTAGYVPPVLAPPPSLGSVRRSQAAASSQLLSVSSSRQTFNSDELLNTNNNHEDQLDQEEPEGNTMIASGPPPPRAQNSNRQNSNHNNQTVRQSRMSNSFQHQQQQQLGPNRFSSVPPGDLVNNVNFNDSSKLIRLQASQFIAGDNLGDIFNSNGAHFPSKLQHQARSQNVLFSQQQHPFGFSENNHQHQHHYQNLNSNNLNQRPGSGQTTSSAEESTVLLHQQQQQQQQRRSRPPKRQQIPSGLPNTSSLPKNQPATAPRSPVSFFPGPQEEPTTSSPQQQPAATTSATTNFLSSSQHEHQLSTTSFLESDALGMRPNTGSRQQFNNVANSGATTPSARQRNLQGGNLQSQGQQAPRQLIVGTASTNPDQSSNLNSANNLNLASSLNSNSNSNQNSNQNSNANSNLKHSQRQLHSHLNQHHPHHHQHHQHHQQQQQQVGNPTSASNNLATATSASTTTNQQQEQDPQLVANRYLSSAIDALEAGQPFGTVDYDFDILNDNSTERRQPSSSLPAATGSHKPVAANNNRPASSSRPQSAQSNAQSSNQTLLLFNSNANANKQRQQQQSFPVRATSGGGDEEGDSISLTNGQPTTAAGQVNSRQFGPSATRAAPERETPEQQPQEQPQLHQQQQQQQAGGSNNNGNRQVNGGKKARPTNRKIVVNHEQALANTRASAEPARRPESLFATPTALQPAGKCDARACRLPDCKCGDTQTPGGLDPKQIPQVVLLTFDDAVNDLNWEIYEELFTGRVNPNGCPILATFYVSHEWTDYGQVQTLYSRGHEMASHSITHSFGEKFSKSQWAKEINGQREILNMYGGVRMQDVRGMRAPFLQIGGNKMFEMLYDANFTYDSSMPIFDNSPPLWPYTLDYQLAHECMITPCPTKSFPGVWEVGMTMWVDLRGGRCSMGDACSNPPDEDGVYEMLMKNFNRHYKSNRAPFGLFYHSAWFNTVHHRRGFLRFMGQVNSLSDVFFVTNWQMLQWMRKPTPISEINSFEPWQCPAKSDRPPPCFHPAVCNVKSEHGTRFMKTCQPCPANQQYPWVGATGFKAKQASGNG